MNQRVQITECEKQLHALIAEVEQGELLRAPVDFKRSVMEKAKRPKGTLEANRKRMSKGLELFFYSLKIGTAAVAAVGLLFLIPIDGALGDWESKGVIELGEQISLSERMDMVTVQIKEITKDWMNKEEW